MNIEEELVNFLHRTMRDNDTKYRDIELILFYFGFREEIWPTLDDAAIRFNVGDSDKRRSERPRQIIKNKFTSKVTLSDLPITQEVFIIIESSRCATIEDITIKLKEKNLVPNSFSIKGILNLLHHLNVCEEYNIYTNRLSTASRQSIESETNLYLLKSSELPEIKKAIRKIRTYPGLVGISNFSTFFKNSEEYATYKELLLNIIRSRDDIWLSNINDDYWYIVEERENTLINNLGKIKNIAEVVNIDTLSIVLLNAFKQRTPPKGAIYPPINVLKKYLESSRFTEFDGCAAKLTLDATNLRDIELDIINYMKNKESISFVDVKCFLEQRGYSKPNINKAILNSTLIFADKTIRRSYTYTLLKSESFTSGIVLDRYEEFKYKLLTACAEGTDIDSMSVCRKEQRLLRSWLFDNKESETCAICSNVLSVNSLVAAHKKPRSICSFNERVDPYIVMPVCKYGCDYLYENCHIIIIDGIVSKNFSKNLTAFECDYIEKISGNIVDKRWLKGDPNYFRRK
ncbi:MULTISPECIES: hypothetical protein [Klebsiella]|uniref:hypothetical protein n=1 Tax=Klebsiella TaxID=570 RepID=UPI0007CC0403|nr:hypothetical protein [Klebsiella oxytoca]MCW9545163.1 hypothetical protein [Klebsiella oxytoca]MCW9566681.1 hypothetical protein [Klebsiella oxytoca]MCW9577238.1 hypothetical protein [Klebsiella oxytoca]MEB6477793.1 hypothetical protein [Klebsiella oxytoca]MEB6496298.1 hypothetical protein [Klebsiella oxytoca]